MALFLMFALMNTTLHAGPRTVEYTLGMPEPISHVFVVSVTLDGLAPDGEYVDLTLPAWRPGRYTILDMAEGVLEFSAADGSGKPLRWRKTDKSTWRVTTEGRPKITATYRVYADEFGLRTRGLDEDHAFVDGSAVFLYAEKYRSLPVRLKVKPFKGWHVTTGLEGKGNTFTAPDYDHFVDCPLEIGKQKDHEFKVKGVPHVLSVFGQAAYDADSLIRDISKIVAAMSDFWGDVPYGKYVFLVHAAPWAGGGTEHINSTIMGTRPENLAPGDGYRGFLGLVAHEFFHTWNVKRLRPKGIVPYDYAKENYTRELWIAEGMTSYYDGLLLTRTGFNAPDRYLNSIASGVREDRMRPGNTVQSLSESSFDAWIKFGRSSPHSYNTETDFYGKGAQVSLLLDLTIRGKTGNGKSLDDVMRLMYRRFPPGGTGYTVDDFQAAASETAGSDLSGFFADYVHGTKPLPWEETFLGAGLRISSRDTAARPWIGLSTRETGDRVFAARVVEGSPARAAGLDGGDEIVALDGKKAVGREIEKAVSARKKGDTVTLTVFRDNVLKEFRVTVKESPVPEYSIGKITEPTPAQKLTYEQWLSTTWESPAQKSDNQ